MHTYKHILGDLYNSWFCGVVVITSASHAEGREFETRQNLGILVKYNFIAFKKTLVVED